MTKPAARTTDTRLAGVLPLSSVAVHVLLALADEDRHGLGIADVVGETTAGRVRLGPGTLYGAIKRLLELGLVDDIDAPDQDADPRRRYYRITTLGRRALAVEAAQLAAVVKLARAKRVF